MNELLETDRDHHQESPSPSASAVISVPTCTQHDAGTQVQIVPERKNARIQTQVRTRTIGIRSNT